MGWFISEEDDGAKRLEIFNELLEDKQGQYEALENVEGSPEAEAQRHKLFEEIKEIELQIEEIREHQERQNDTSHDRGLDAFGD